MANPYEIRVLGSVKRANKDINDAYSRGWNLHSMIVGSIPAELSGSGLIAIFTQNHTMDVKDEPLARLAGK